MSNDLQFSPIINNRIQWDRLSMIPARCRNSRDLYFDDLGPGYLDVVDNQLVFKFSVKKPDKTDYDLRLDLDQINYLSLLPWNDQYGPRSLLIVHYSPQWVVHAFDLTLDRLRELMGRLQHARPDIPLAPYPDYGPQTARLYEQDIYGAWSMNMHTSRLYIAPDRLIFTDIDDLLLAHITKLTLISGDGYPTLRIDYHLPEEPKLRNLGIRVWNDDAETWASILQDRTGIPFERLVAPKKKPGDG